MNRAKPVRKLRPLMTPEQQAADDQKLLDELNAEFPVGMVVWYWTSLVPGSPVKETRIQRPFFLVPTSYPDGENLNQPVTFLEGVRGYVSAWHIKRPFEEQRPHLDLEIVHSGEGGRP